MDRQVTIILGCYSSDDPYEWWTFDLSTECPSFGSKLLHKRLSTTRLCRIKRLANGSNRVKNAANDLFTETNSQCLALSMKPRPRELLEISREILSSFLSVKITDSILIRYRRVPYVLYPCFHEDMHIWACFRKLSGHFRQETIWCHEHLRSSLQSTCHLKSWFGQSQYRGLEFCRRQHP